MKKMIVIFAVLTALIACDNDSSKNGNLPKPVSIGKTGEILTIINNPEWDSEIGDTIRSVFKKPYPMLPQSEQSFNLLQLANSSFVQVMKKHRSILLISLSDEFKSTKLTVSRDLWAAPQIVINALGSDVHSIANLIASRRDTIFKLFEQSELALQSALAVQYSDRKNFDSVKKKFNVDLHIPTDYYLMRNDRDFMWFESQTTKSSMGIFVYTSPISADTVLSLNSLISRRDSILREKVHGARDSSWMTTTDFILPEFEIKIDDNGLQYGELRGLWELVNDYMGGPFVSRSYIDRKRNRIITVEGYVYAAGDKKRDRIRKITGILNTLKKQEE
ncbi:MAG: DUF4837 family protein [Prevotellaceae bacterium]|jgi:hypothetical protein|nr:DUF4837 family protein [Prevotellaceae bacterium]